MLELAAIELDRRRLRERWQSLGYHGNRSIPQRLLEGVREYPEVESIYYAEKKLQPF